MNLVPGLILLRGLVGLLSAPTLVDLLLGGRRLVARRLLGRNLLLRRLLLRSRSGGRGWSRLRGPDRLLTSARCGSVESDLVGHRLHRPHEDVQLEGSVTTHPGAHDEGTTAEVDPVLEGQGLREPIRDRVESPLADRQPVAVPIDDGEGQVSTIRHQPASEPLEVHRDHLVLHHVFEGDEVATADGDVTEPAPRAGETEGVGIGPVALLGRLLVVSGREEDGLHAASVAEDQGQRAEPTSARLRGPAEEARVDVADPVGRVASLRPRRVQSRQHVEGGLLSPVATDGRVQVHGGQSSPEDDLEPA